MTSPFSMKYCGPTIDDDAEPAKKPPPLRHKENFFFFGFIRIFDRWPISVYILNKNHNWQKFIFWNVPSNLEKKKIHFIRKVYWRRIFFFLQWADKRLDTDSPQIPLQLDSAAKHFFVCNRALPLLRLMCATSAQEERDSENHSNILTTW